MTMVLTILINGLVFGSVYALLSMGLSTQYGVARILNIAHGEFIVLASFITWELVTDLGVHPLTAIAAAGAILFVIGFALHRTLFKRVRDISPNAAAFEGDAILVAFGVYFILQNLMRIKWGSQTTGYSFMAYPVSIGGAQFQARSLFVFAFAAVICVLYNLFLSHTRTGKSIRAAAQDPVAARMLGVKINRVMAICFGIGGFLAACAGVLISMNQTFSSVTGLNYTVIAVIVVVLGGLGSIRGSILSGFILGIVGTAVNSYDPSIMLVVFYLIILVLLIVRPKGLLGR
ncbi:MAG: branched-chain amino acid ABC transporter permease [Oscillospiraceae bacterium]|jgi:branched-chain amino acid transport system permease protein|nr:branched-chain amino acid ABC transporter permease [Oscillospiraceae bacterium]